MKRLFAALQPIVHKHRQFLLYALIGMSGVTLDFILFALGTRVFGLGILTANFLAISIAILNNFWLNSVYNFKKRDHFWKRFGLFYAVGALGILLSELLIALFHYGTGASDLTAKLLTLPFVLVFQFALNKRFSFGDIKQTEQRLKKLFFHLPGYLVIAVFMVFCFGFVRGIPSDFSKSTPAYAPDEVTHYIFNVEFILKNERLPVSGQDDVAAYRNCRDNENGKVACLYSYTVYPGPNYVISAISAGLLPRVFDISPQTAARVPTLLYSLVFAISIYFTAYLLSRRRLYATLITASVLFIPQVMFTLTYTNLDSHSMAISGLLGLALAYFLTNPKKKWALPLLAVACAGLLPLAKYNFFVLALPVIGFVAYYYLRNKITQRQLLMAIAWAAGSFLVLASFWYIRNLILYHDPLGQSFVLEEMSKYHELGQSHPLNLSGLLYLNELKFFDILFKSFFFGLGGMFYFLEEYFYLLPGAFLLLAVVLLGVRAAEVKTLRWAFAGFLVMFILTLGQVIYNSLIYDFQPQGRYLFPVLIPAVFLLAYSVRIDKQANLPVVLFVTSTLFIFFSGLGLMALLYF